MTGSAGQRGSDGAKKAMPHGALRYPPSALEDFATRVLESFEMPRDDAAIVARSLVSANLRGIDTHGVARIPYYADRFPARLVDPRPRITLESRMPWAASIDGDNAMGAVVGWQAMQEALDRADRLGVGGATVRRSNHYGAAAFYALEAVKHDCIGLSLAPASKSLAPYGSREPLFGTNPIAVAVPAGKYPPWTMDMASSIAARGHIRLAARRGEKIPEGWALDRDGEPTTDAEAALAGVMVPFAGPKGSALAMLIDVLGGVLSGSGFGGTIRDMTRDFEAPQDVGHFFLAFKVEAFMPLDVFAARMETEIERLKALAPAKGFTEVMYPGEIEARREAQRRADGIPLPPEVIRALQAVGDERSLPFPDGAPEPSAKT